MRTVIVTANEKGGVGKSHLSAETNHFATSIPEIASHWHFVEVEQRPSFSQSFYEAWGDKIIKIPLFERNEASERTDLSLRPLDELLKLIPDESTPDIPSRILIDFGASTFQSFLLWLVERRGLKAFTDANYKFVFLIPTVEEYESIQFVNEYVPKLKNTGQVIIVKNMIKGSDFSRINPEITRSCPMMTLLDPGPPMTNELNNDPRGIRHTYASLMRNPNASRRARLDAEMCLEHITKQFRTSFLPYLN